MKRIVKGPFASPMTKQTRVIGLLCGNGDLPGHLITEITAHKIPLHCVGFEGFTDLFETPSTQSWHKIGHIGEIVQTLKDHHVTHIVMAGSLKRPSLTSLSMDIVGAKWFARLGLSAFGGDDALLSKMIELMENEGFEILSPHTLLPELLHEASILTGKKPCCDALQDIERGKSILQALSPFDVGQAIVVQQGLVLGIEAVEGTEALLKRIIPLKKEGFGGVLVKLAKEGQSLKVDVPTIGVETAKQVHKAGLVGIAISANTTQILDCQHVVNYCNNHNLFLSVIE